MSIDKTTVLKVAKLARIKFADDRVDAMISNMNSILKMVEELGEVKTEGVEPMTSVVDIKFPERQDKVTDGDKQEKVLANAPDKDAGYYLVPKIIE